MNKITSLALLVIALFASALRAADSSKEMAPLPYMGANGYVLIKQDSPKQALATALSHWEGTKQDDSGGEPLRPAIGGNIMDEPQKFSKSIAYPIAFMSDKETLSFLKKDASGKWVRVGAEDIPADQPVYLSFYRPTRSDT